MKKRAAKILSVHSAVIAAVVVYALLPFKCPINYLFHIPCPTCGMTRSFFALLKGDFSRSFSLNPLTIPFILILLFAIHKDFFKISNKSKNIIIISGAIFVFLIYLLRNFV